jgi:hypothetical protein
LDGVFEVGGGGRARRHHLSLSLPVHLLVVRPQTEDLDGPLPFEDLIDQTMLDIDAA